MADLYLSSDYHLGHQNIIKYCNRPFSSLEEMNTIIIKNHNERVKKEDTFIHVGDFCFKNSPGGKHGEGLPIHSKTYIEQLNGRLVFIKGNHDSANSLDTKIERLVLNIGGMYINVCHKPDDAVIEDKLYYPLNLVGHIHEKWTTKELKQNKISLLLNVGVDVHKFKPISFVEIKKIFDLWLKNHPNRKAIQRWILQSRNNSKNKS